MKVDLYRVILPVTDIEGAAAFYGRLLDQPGQRVSPGRHYFECGGTVLACYDAEADGDEAGEGWRPHDNQYLYFAVPDVEAARSRALELGARDVTAVEAMPWGETLFYARDPFGNPVSFVQSGTEFTGA